MAKPTQSTEVIPIRDGETINLVIDFAPWLATGELVTTVSGSGYGFDDPDSEITASGVAVTTDDEVVDGVTVLEGKGVLLAMSAPGAVAGSYLPTMTIGTSEGQVLIVELRVRVDA